MPAKGKVSIGWQVVFAIVSPINLWAFYRIKKLRLYALYVVVPSVVISSIIIAGVFYEMDNLETEFGDETKYPEPTLPPYMTPIEPQVGKFNTGPYMTQHNYISWVDDTFSLSGCKMVKAME